LNKPNNNDPHTAHSCPQIHVEKPTISMVYNIIKRLKKNKAPGEDRTAELKQ
jgi:hypothetical protein